MGFVGLVLSAEKQTLDVPQGFTLQLLMACLDLECKACPTKKGAFSTVYVQPGGHDKFIMCHLGADNDVNVAIQQEYSIEDSPVTLWCTVGQVHLTGRWALADETEDREEDEGEEDEEEEEFSQPATEPAKVATKSENQKKRPREEKIAASSSSKPAAAKPATAVTATSSSAATTTTSVVAVAPEGPSRTAKKKAKAAEQDELLALASMMAPQIIEAPTQVTQHHRKKWKIKPENDEGVQVPEPRQKAMPCGILYTDHVVGRGVEPKLGTKIKITYEGSFPDGTVFDTRVKRSKPFVFRKGAADVIRGLDMGVEGMRVGGSREIIVPAALG